MEQKQKDEDGLVLKRKAYQVLAEDDYLRKLKKIIRNEFFGTKIDDNEGRESKLRVSSLTRFFEKYTSEDNDSFAKLQEKDDILMRKNYKWAFSTSIDLNTKKQFLSLQTLTNSTQPRIKNRINTSEAQTSTNKKLKNSNKGLIQKNDVNISGTRFSSELVEKFDDNDSIYTKQTDIFDKPRVNGYSFLLPERKTNNFSIQSSSLRERLADKLLSSCSRLKKQRNHTTKVSKNNKKRPLTPAGKELLERLRKKR